MYQKIFLSTIIVALLVTSATFVACSDTNASAVAPQPPVAVQTKPQAVPVMVKDIIDVASASADHTTLVAAIKAAGLVETLRGAGPFTVFAPTNAAFDMLPAGTVEGLLKPEKKAALTKILTYHVVAGAVKAADLKDGQKIKTLQGEELTVVIKNGMVMINGAHVTTANLEASNGVIHVIDGVLMPK